MVISYKSQRTMSSLSISNSFDFITKQINIYFGLSIFIIGLIGNLFNILIFKTLKTFTKTTCTFLLTMVSIFNIGQLMVGVLISILAAGFDIDPVGVSHLCKIRKIMAQWFGLVSLNSICLATIDRFFSIKYQYSINFKSANGFITTTCLFWFIHGIFFIFSWDVFHGICSTMHTNFETYITYFHFPVPIECFPLMIMVIFTFLIFINLQKELTSQQRNIVRSNRERQLTTMVLIQVIFIISATIPFLTGYICSLSRQYTDTEHYARDRLINTIINYIYYTTYANSFYLYCFGSKRFRKQFVYVLSNIHLERRRPQTN